MSDNLGACTLAPRGFSKIAPPAACTGLACIEAGHVPCDRAQPMSQWQHACCVPSHPLENLSATRRLPVLRRQERLRELGQQIRSMIGFAADHHAIRPCEELLHLVDIAHATVRDDRELWEVTFHALHDVVAQGWNLAIVARRESGEHGLARVNRKYVAATRGHHADETMQS